MPVEWDAPTATTTSSALPTPRPHALHTEQHEHPAVVPEGDGEAPVAAGGLVPRDEMMWTGVLPLAIN